MSAAVGALSGPLHGGAPAHVIPMLDEVARPRDADAYVSDMLDRGERIMGFGHRVYRAEDPRARLLRRTAQELGSPRVEVAEALETRRARRARASAIPERVLATNVEFWSAVVLDVAEIPPALTPAMFACARVAGWSAHILEQKRTGRLIRPSARYVGPGSRSLAVGLNLPEAAAEADALAQRGDERELADLRTEWGDELEACRPRPGLPRARARATGRSGSSASARRSSCCAAGSRTRARRRAARRSSRSSCSRATRPASSTGCARCSTSS